jgi:hypothetical protein
MTRDGELDGLVLSGGSGRPMLVHFPPHMGGEVAASIRVGDHIAVHGVYPRLGQVFAAVALIAQDGHQVRDDGPDAAHHTMASSPGDRLEEAKQVTGTVSLSLLGPKGELRGAVLDDGTVIRLGKKEAATCSELLKPGATLAARGTAIVSAHGTVVDADAVGPTLDALQPVKGTPPDARHAPRHADSRA